MGDHRADQARTNRRRRRRQRIPVPVDLTPQQRRVVETPGVTYLGRDSKGRPVVEGLAGIPQQVRRWALARSGDPLDVEASDYGRPETGRWPAEADERTFSDPDDDPARGSAADDAAWRGDKAKLPEAVAWGRAETEPCERGTVGCSVLHTRDSECETW